MDAPKPAMTTSSQPQAVQMSVMNPPARESNQTQQECRHKRGFAERLRGGGAAKDCFLGMIECFLCFECCKVSDRECGSLLTILMPELLRRIAASASRTSSVARARCAA
ncbi:hypothetical protein L226DRAFT_532494, partial [Lentinus tigrinus ALCF2SS1-7]|uniref:uncharacterized protein n=1 Tax=Lentinus tigrinus ALCF2SS1-7 TaxID=1328758 RepID=UPI0011662540